MYVVSTVEKKDKRGDMGASDNTRGLILAIVSSLFIGASFILKKKGLRRAAAAGTRAGGECSIYGTFFLSLLSSVLSS